MNTGKMRHRVSLLAPTLATNTMGERVAAWSEIARVWARVEPLTGRELYSSQQVQAGLTHKVTIRYRPGVSPVLRIGYLGRMLEILWAKDVEERHEQIECYCIEVIE